MVSLFGVLVSFLSFLCLFSSVGWSSSRLSTAGTGLCVRGGGVSLVCELCDVSLGYLSCGMMIFDVPWWYDIIYCSSGWFPFSWMGYREVDCGIMKRKGFTMGSNPPPSVLLNSNV